MERRIRNLSKKICREHFDLTDCDECRNLHMLWYMYVKGVKKGTYKPFVFLAELKLLEYLGYMDESSVENAIRLLESPDKENLFVASQVIKFFRNERIKEMGEFNLEKSRYIQTRIDYESKIMNSNLWSKKQKLEEND
tara:strand:- start:94199 stop:94612 length:414 start_codon:yes stop_codon:yes gene_type:complete